MVLNAQRQIMDVAVQQHQQRQFDAFQALSQREQPQPHPFFGLPPSSNAQGGGSTLTPSATDFARPPLPGLPDFLLSSDLPFRRDEAYAPKAPPLDNASPFSLPSSSFGLYDSQFAPSFRVGSMNSFPSDAAFFGFERDIGEQEDLGDDNLEDDGDDGEGASSSSAPREPSERRQRNTAASGKFDGS
ncbi:hypothetical protein DL93DRAFT_1461945 [Clavulina sp. PMI_390]|nr:hypothetical protein DL93DRAFT_1461945 [Clavulina sp. PMI_390]